LAATGGRGRATTGTRWRLHERGYISDPKTKAKSVVLSEEGERRARELFARHFGGKVE
jgi:Mn-dependent DtxR family transcriptional regulator